MNKKPFSRFFNLNLRHDGGFTLVELIVVIAILAILAGVAVPVYSGYVEKTNRTADEALIAEVKNALVLQYYTEGLVGEASVILTDKGARPAGDFAEKAMAASFGSNLSNVALKSTHWGNAAGVTMDVLNHFAEKRNDPNDPLYGIYAGDTKPSFVKDVDKLFPEVEQTAVAVGGRFETSGAALLQGAAGLTLGITVPEGNTQKKAEYFADKWATAEWDSSYLMGANAGEYGAGVGSNENKDVVNGAVANAAVIKARNTAIAGYIQRYVKEQYPDKDVSADAIANRTYGSTSQVPKDFVDEWFDATSNSDKGNLLEAVGIPRGNVVAVRNAIDAYFAGGTASEAYKDGLAYFAMMETVQSVNPNENDDTYWKEMQAAVGEYSKIANGADFDEIKGYYDSLNLTDVKISVTITIKGTEDGYELS